MSEKMVKQLLDSLKLPVTQKWVDIQALLNAARQADADKKRH